MTQSVTAGQSVQEGYAQRYRPVGVKGEKLHKPLNRCFWQAVGRYAHGKSRLVQTNSKALILNLDESPTTTNNPEAEIWPAVNDMGQTVDTDGSPLVLTWSRVNEVIQHVLTAARQGLPGTPECVVIDSLPSAVRLCLHHSAMKLINQALARQGAAGGGGATSVALEDITPFEIKALHGMTLYGITYDVIADLIDSMRHANLGVGVVLHLDFKQFEAGRTKQGEAIMEDRPVLSISDALRDRYFRVLDFSFVVQREKQVVTSISKGEEKFIMAGDKKRKVKTKAKQVQKEEDVTKIVTSNEELSNFLKVREGLPAEFTVDSWQDLETTYNAAAETTT